MACPLQFTQLKNASETWFGGFKHLVGSYFDKVWNQIDWGFNMDKKTRGLDGYVSRL